MPDNPVISQITLPNGRTYDIKDAYAREAIADINSFDYVLCNTIETTPQGVTWSNGSTIVTGTLAPSAQTKGKMYLVLSTNGMKNVYDEYITVQLSDSVFIWELFGHSNIAADDLGDLAYKNSAQGSYTPNGTISVQTAGATDNVFSITDVGTLPVLSTVVSDENLTIGFSQGTLPTKGSAQTVKTGDAAYSFSGTAATITVT